MIPKRFSVETSSPFSTHRLQKSTAEERSPPGLPRRSKTKPFNFLSARISFNAAKKSTKLSSLKLVKRTYPMPKVGSTYHCHVGSPRSERLFLFQPFTERILMLSRFRGTSNGSGLSALRTVSVTTSPAGPVMRSTALFNAHPVVLCPSTAIMRSFGFKPARAAGEPSSGFTI